MESVAPQLVENVLVPEVLSPALEETLKDRTGGSSRMAMRAEEWQQRARARTETRDAETAADAGRGRIV